MLHNLPGLIERMRDMLVRFLDTIQILCSGAMGGHALQS